jgi:O-antigen/teichoic acid export membrane protein
MTAVDPELATATGGLGKVLKRGAAMSAVSLVICQCVTVVQTIVLGRLLGPAEVGVFAAGSVVIGVVLVTHSALSQALIQRERDLEHAANTVLVVTFTTGLLLGLAVLAASPLIGGVFHDDRVTLIAAATSGLLVLHACSSVPDALMQRAFQFKRRIIVDPAISVAFAVVSTIFAVQGFGAWAMVIGTYASTLTGVVLTWWLAKWRPFQGKFSFRIWREMAGFSFPLLLDGVAERAREMFEQMLVGRHLGTADLGQFRYAYRIASMPSMAVIQICSYVLFPAFARISGDPVRFRDAFLRALGWIWFAALPAGMLLVVAGEPIVVLLLGPEWRPAGSATAAMAGIGVGVGLTSVAWEAIKGAGRSSLLNWVTGLSLVLVLPLIVVLLPLGLVGVGIAISAMHLVIGCVTVEIARRVVGASAREAMRCLIPATISAATALTVVLPLERLLIAADTHGTLAGLAMVVGECLLFVAVYLGVLKVVGPHQYRSVHGVFGRGLARLRGALVRAA